MYQHQRATPYLCKVIYEINDKLISEEIFEKRFVCDLAACKGACCVEGDAGAPLEEAELELLDDAYDAVKPYMRQEGLDAVEKQGLYTIDIDGDYVTPLVHGKECAFVAFDEKGIAKCAIEQAHSDGKTAFKKPISCHLYPIRISKLSVGDAINFHDWQICDPALKCGAKLEVPVFRFLKEPLIRKYGTDFFEALCKAHELRDSEGT